MVKYKNQHRKANGKGTTPPAPSPVQQTLDDYIRQAIAEKLPELLEQEVQTYLGRQRYEHHATGAAKHYRNGYGKERCVSCGCGSLVVRVPRLREPYESKIVGRYQRLSDEVRATLPELYAHGLATGDFEQCLHLLLGDEAPLSDATIVRLKAAWKNEYEQWQKRPLEAEYLYVWVDGVYPKAGPKEENLALLVVVGLNRRGDKEILALAEGYRESAESWRDVFRSLKKRGLRWLGLVIADGLDGVWKAVRDVYPQAGQQRCWVHKMRNVLDKVPHLAQEEVREALRAIYDASSRQEALRLKEAFIQQYQSHYPRAVASLQEAGERLFAYFAFPKPHWKSIKSTNVIESMFATVKLRTDAARRIPNRESATCLVFKLLTNAQRRFNRIHGYKLVAETIDRLNMKQSLPRLRRAA
jgi:transposase-like protein